jgi:acyl-CoA synthetase (AMP-forming)/AMP-acid ligase II
MSICTGLSRIIERNAQVRGDKPAIITETETRDWQQTKVRIECAANGMSKLGVKATDKIAIMGLNTDRYFEFLFIPAWLGAIAVPLNTRWSILENEYALIDSNSSVLVFDDAFLDVAEKLKETCEHLKIFIYIGNNHCPTWAFSYTSLYENSSAIESTSVDGEDVAFIMYTGGTTGHPKGVMQTHNGFFSSSMSFAMDFDFSDEERYLHAAPMFHVADCGVGMAMSICGGSHSFVESFTPSATIDIIKRDQISVAVLVPTMIKMMMDSPSLSNADFSSLKKLIYGASPMQESLAIQTIETLPHVDIYQAYGQTELCPAISVSKPKDHVIGNRRMRSAGRATYCTHIRIRKENGELAKTGDVGEVEVAGPNIMLGYLNLPELTAETLIDGYIKTGDAGYLDDGGYLFLVDRVKDMIITGGENVFSSEVESVISLHPSVSDVVVIGIPHEQWGEQVHAIVIIKQGEDVNEEQIKAFCKKTIAGYKCPKSIEFTQQAFPLSAAGKVLKNEIRKPYWAKQARMVN